LCKGASLMGGDFLPLNPQKVKTFLEEKKHLFKILI